MMSNLADCGRQPDQHVGLYGLVMDVNTAALGEA